MVLVLYKESFFTSSLHRYQFLQSISSRKRIAKSFNLSDFKRMQNLEIRVLADEIRSQLCVVPSRYQEFCICRVSREVQQANRTAYIPTTISSGPLHHQRRDLNSMEEYKVRYTKSFLEKTPLLSLENYLKAMQGLENEILSCYHDGDINFTSKKFKKIVLYDGCFIIELLLRFKREVPISRDDPIFSKIGLLNKIRRDLILFENQLPFFVLQCLFNLSAVFNRGPSLIDLSLYFFSEIIPGHKKLAQGEGADLKHLLDLVRHSYAPTSSDMLPFENDPKALLYSATDLKLKAGIKFKTIKTGSLLDIKFHSNGCLEIPRVKLRVETETLFRNLLAFEQCCERSNTYITDYISFMGNLIKDWDDADLLMDHGVIQSCLPCDCLAVTDLFKTLRKEVIVHNCYYSRLCKRVNSHCIRPRTTQAETFVLFYIAGILLFFLWFVAFRHQ